LRRSVLEATGLTDAWPVQRERFSQWVIEDEPLPCKDAWEMVGVIFSKDVNAFELAKLRMLNGQHSALAYLGILAGWRTVFDAVGDPQLGKFLAQLVETEIRPSIPSPPGMDLAEYSASLVERFRNPMIEHRLEQIAIDGSQKIPIRIFAPLRENLAAGRPIHCLCLVIAAWLNFLETHNADTLDDPMAAELLAVRDILQENTSRGIRAFFDLQLVRKGGLPDDPQLMSELGFACDSLRGVRGTAVGDSINRYLAQCETKP
jgi:fructuronate reductase